MKTPSWDLKPHVSSQNQCIGLSSEIKQSAPSPLVAHEIINCSPICSTHSDRDQLLCYLWRQSRSWWQSSHLLWDISLTCLLTSIALCLIRGMQSVINVSIGCSTSVQCDEVSFIRTGKDLGLTSQLDLVYVLLLNLSCSASQTKQMDERISFAKQVVSSNCMWKYRLLYIASRKYVGRMDIRWYLTLWTVWYQ